MKYTIKINYQTGDSFGSRDTVNTVELEWENLDAAKAALKRIKEHYAWYQDINCKYCSDHKEISQPEWHKEKFGEGKEYEKLYQLVILTDKGKEFQFTPFWCGYFERLKCAEIVTVEDPEMKYEP